MTEREWILAQVKLAAALKPGTVTVLTYRHDAGCPTLDTGRGQDCRCAPDLEVVPVPHDRPRGGSPDA